MTEKYNFGDDGILPRIGEFIYNIFDIIFNEKKYKHNFSTGLVWVLKWIFILIFWVAIFLFILYNLILGYRLWTSLFLIGWVFVEVFVKIGYYFNN